MVKHCPKTLMDMNDVVNDRILVSDNFLNRKSLRKEDFCILLLTKMIKIIKPLCTLLPRISGYLTGFEETQYMFLLIKNDQLLENTIARKYKSTKKLAILYKNFLYQTSEQ